MKIASRIKNFPFKNNKSIEIKTDIAKRFIAYIYIKIHRIYIYIKIYQILTHKK